MHRNSPVRSGQAHRNISVAQVVTSHDTALQHSISAMPTIRLAAIARQVWSARGQSVADQIQAQHPTSWPTVRAFRLARARRPAGTSRARPPKSYARRSSPLDLTIPHGSAGSSIGSVTSPLDRSARGSRSRVQDGACRRSVSGPGADRQGRAAGRRVAARICPTRSPGS